MSPRESRASRLGLIALLALTGCPVQRLVADQTAVLLEEGALALQRETDLELAEAAIPGNLKMLEGFLESSPHNPRLLLLLAEGTTGYAFGFLEDTAEVVATSDPARARHLRQRARALHLRARGYGLRQLALTAPELAAHLAQEQPATPEQLAALQPDQVPGLFWTASPWAAAIAAGRDDPALVAQLGLVKPLLERCAELDETYFWGGALMALGALEAAVPKVLGGDPEAATRWFERAVAVTGGAHLMTKVFYARGIAQQTEDRARFERLLEEVLRASPDLDPRLSLVNRLAQRRARRDLAAIDDLFL